MHRGMLLLFVVGLWLTSLNTVAHEWLTFSSSHFRVHFQPHHQTWAEKAAIELERARKAVLNQQGRALNVVVDAVILDPFNLPNGYALPSSDNPLMVLYVTPPQSDMEIAHHQSWLQLLVLHEYIHLVHLSQPSRHAHTQWLRDLSDSYDLAVAAQPRWVAEGYATLQESKLTGKGRLFDNYSEALLRAYARQGALLPYAALNFGDGSYRASAMAYLLGSRFLAWLEAEFGQQTLDAVWTRTMAVESRDFESAFNGIFGQPARRLYQRFIAQYTFQAIQHAQQLTPFDSREFMQFAFAARDVEFSKSQRKFAAVETNQHNETVLKVYASEENTAALTQFKAQQKALLMRDPQDIADRQPDSFVHEVLATYEPVDFSGIYHPQWGDEDTLYFVARSKGQSGSRVNDLYRWHVSGDQVTRVSRGLGIRRFAFINTHEVIAERVINGFSQLIRFDTQSKLITVLLSGDLNTVFDYPTVDSRGDRLAYLKQTPAQGWQLFVTNLAQAHTAVQVPLPEGAQYVTAPRWHEESQILYFVAGRHGELGLYQYHLLTKILRQLAFGSHVFEEVVGNLNGQLLFLESTPYGAKLGTLADTGEFGDATLMAHAAPHAKGGDKVTQIDTESLHLGPYHASAQNWGGTVSAQVASASEAMVGLGIAGSDILKKYSWQAGVNVSPDNDFLRGGYADLKYFDGLFELKNAVRLFDFDLTRQSAERLSRSADWVGWSNTLELATTFEREGWVWRPYTGWYVEALRKRSVDHSYWLGNQLAFHRDRQAFAFGFSVDGASIWGHNRGHDLVMNGYAKLWHWPIFLQSINRYRDQATMQIGGYRVNSVYDKVGANSIHSAELPFAYERGLHYLGYEFATSWRGGMPRLYLKHHKIDGHMIARSWGAKWQIDLTRKVLGNAAQFAPAGVSNLRLGLGLSRVTSDVFDNEWRAWFGVWHEL
ncbi:hypothetical protein L1286_19790 [Pseudoalteromonas sp. SMS1]|uniref:TolB family protein n=1 Tax=Pseudoalteromonas sp. SMS1 TaxID=2908894 RepID=UPI001F34CF53|nr:hypothetical protein [Pseudoalteromonas sp. SMS1]MCF2859726.1 hypothetical protein [Pseudoalteromonas sp. SMS1]